MFQEIINFISNINIGYVIFIALFLIVSLLFLNENKVNNILKEIYIIIYITISWIGFYYLNDILNSIFLLKYLSVKLYLILLIIGNMIMLITINKNMKKSYKITNYIIFAINVIIFMTNIFIIVSNKFNTFVVTSTEEISKLIDINLISFIIYLSVMCIIYIINHFQKLKKGDKKIVEFSTNDINNSKIEHEKEINREIFPTKLPSFQKKQEGFYIDGVDCSIIFEESDQEIIIKNYYILLNDINAKLTNGYTLTENIKLKNIINRLNIKDLNNINLDVNKLSKITIDEYNLLKRYIDNKKSF